MFKIAIFFPNMLETTNTLWFKKNGKTNRILARHGEFIAKITRKSHFFCWKISICEKHTKSLYKSPKMVQLTHKLVQRCPIWMVKFVWELFLISNFFCDFMSICTSDAWYIYIYRKPPNISPGLIFVQRHFLGGLYSGGLILGGAYIRRRFSVSNNHSMVKVW